MCYQRIIYQDYKNIFSNNANESLSIFHKMPIINDSFYNTLMMLYNIIIFTFIFGILVLITQLSLLYQGHVLGILTQPIWLFAYRFFILSTIARP